MTRKILSLTLVLALLLCALPTQAFMAGTSPYTGTGFELQYKVTSKWSGAQNIQMTLKNTGSAVIQNWAVGFYASGSADSPWSCAIGTGSEGYCVIENAGWNAKIAVNGSVTFGFTLRTDETFSPDVFYIGDEARNPPVVPTDPDDPIIDPNDPTIDWDNLDENDDDEDGLPNWMEDYFGTDKNNPDTDGDELPDGYEVLTLGSDPLTPDGDLDFDEDGLSNLQEYLLGTDPQSDDTDGDGLTDGDEVHITGTDPLNPDTDDDTIWDGDEIELGLDPLNPVTDGITPDGERIFEREISTDAFDDSVFEDNAATPHLTVVSTGDPENQVVVTESDNAQLAQNPAIVGKNVNVFLTNQVESGTIAFELAQQRPLEELMICRYDTETQDLLPLQTTLDENGYFSAELDGSGNYFMMDIDLFIEYLGIDIEETVNQAAQDSAVSEAITPSLFNLSPEIQIVPPSDNSDDALAELFDYIDSLGEMDDDEWEQFLENLPKTSTITSSDKTIQENTAISPRMSIMPMSNSVSEPTYVLFLVDTTTSMANRGGTPPYMPIVMSIIRTMAEVTARNPDAHFAIAEYGGHSTDPSTLHYFQTIWSQTLTADILNLLYTFTWGKNPNDLGKPIYSLEWALGFFNLAGAKDSSNRHVVIVTDTADLNADTSGVHDDLATLMDTYIANNVACSALVLDEHKDNYKELYRTGGALFTLDTSALNVNLAVALAEHLAKPGELPREKSCFITLKGGYRVELDEPLDFANKTVDTDDDGVPDSDEVLNIQGTMNIVDMLIHRYQMFFILTPSFIPIEFEFVLKLPFVTNVPIAVYDWISDPTKEDTDDDGYWDDVDLLPREPFRVPVLFLPDINSETEFGITYNTTFPPFGYKVSGGKKLSQKVAPQLQSMGYKLNVDMFCTGDLSTWNRPNGYGIEVYIEDRLLGNKNLYPTQSDYDNYIFRINLIDYGVKTVGLKSKDRNPCVDGMDYSMAGHGALDFMYCDYLSHQESQYEPTIIVEKILSFKWESSGMSPSLPNLYNTKLYKFSKDDQDAPADNLRLILEPSAKDGNGQYATVGGDMIGAAEMDGYFSQSATALSTELEKLSVEAAMFAYDDVLWIGSHEPYHLQHMLNGLLFKDVDSENYRDTDEDNISYTFAHKTLPGGKELIAVILRGTDSFEWQGDFKVWEDKDTIEPNGYHYSFKAGADSLYEPLNAYMRSHGLSKTNAKLWITGHSRGAAVANLFAARLTDEGIIGKDNIYAYTFATPNVKIPTSAVEKQKMLTGYDNIKNYVNKEDFVPHVPMDSDGGTADYSDLTRWQYTKYGKTVGSPGDENGEFSSVAYSETEAFKKANNIAGKFSFDAEVDTCKKGIDAFLKDAPTVEKYYESGSWIVSRPDGSTSEIFLRPLFPFVYETLALAAMGEIHYAAYVGGVLNGSATSTGLYFFDNKSAIFSAHTPETYYAYVMTKT